MPAKVLNRVRQGGALWAAHILGVVIGVALGTGFMGFAVGASLPVECAAHLTGWIAQH